MTLYLTLFLAGMVTILLPCILPLVPVVVGVSIAGRSRLRPLLTVLGMIVSFVLFTFLLLVVLNSFVELADIIRTATFAVLFLFGVGFLTNSLTVHRIAGLLTGLFFSDKGWAFALGAALVGLLVMEAGGRIASRLQETGLSAQTKARAAFGSDSALSAFVIGTTLGLVWVPCAGPALGFALTLVRNEPGPMAALALTSYALGTAVPLLIVGYGGQAAVHSVRFLTRFTGTVKTVSGVLLIATAIGLQTNAFQDLQIWISEHTMYGDLGTRIEDALFAPDAPETSSSSEASVSSSASAASVAAISPSSPSSSSRSSMKLPVLPKIVRAPELAGLGPWHNSDPLTMAGLKGKVVLVDFWTYSCINCIRTLPYMKGYWQKYKDTGTFVLLGVHSPEFTFEKSEANVAAAIKERGLTYPVAQDNDFRTWSAFSNRYWPAKYLIDADGYIRYTHFGEGAYEETDLAIASLLKEAGVDIDALAGDMPEETASKRRSVSPETYLGERSWPALANAKGDPSSDTVLYTAPQSLKLHSYALEGSWQLVDGEHQSLVSESGKILLHFLGGEANLVLGLPDGASPVQATVSVDGGTPRTFTIDHHDLYQLYKGEHGDHNLVLTLSGKGAEAFAFTFGG